MDVHHNRAGVGRGLEASSAQGNLRLEQARHHEHIGGEAIPLDWQKEVRDSGSVQHLLGTDDVRAFLSYARSASPLSCRWNYECRDNGVCILWNQVNAVCPGVIQPLWPTDHSTMMLSAVCAATLPHGSVRNSG